MSETASVDAQDVVLEKVRLFGVGRYVGRYSRLFLSEGATLEDINAAIGRTDATCVRDIGGGLLGVSLGDVFFFPEVSLVMWGVVEVPHDGATGDGPAWQLVVIAEPPSGLEAVGDTVTNIADEQAGRFVYVTDRGEAVIRAWVEWDVLIPDAVDSENCYTGTVGEYFQSSTAGNFKVVSSQVAPSGVTIEKVDTIPPDYLAKAA